ncbi:hypothetical protein R1sor_003150 [Riccia sorocarpa]|uniref:RING-type domain-containing protein n=1 Tax=Riccia sorocarpa TaxID=122646 RepID=A0ABD3H0S0_9MARC
MGGGGPADDGGGSGSGSGSHVAIVPSGDGPSSAPSPSTPSALTPSWLPLVDREALLRWIESSLFVFVDREHHESAPTRLVEAEGAKSSLRRLLAKARDAEKAVEEALQRANAVVGDLTSRAAGAEARIEAVRLELQGRDSRIRALESQPPDEDEGPVQAPVPVQHPVEVLEGPGDGPPPADGGPPLTDAQKLALAEAQVARLKTQFELTEEAIKVERLRNFADGSDRAAWEVERTTLQRDVDFARESRDQGIDLNMILVRGNKAMWLPAAREVWNTANRNDDLQRIATFFPGWAPLAPTDGGTIGLSPIWHRKDCGVCHNFFGLEGGYLPGSCGHPVHIACLLKLIVTGTSCVVCRAPYHKRLWYQFAVEKHLQAAAAFSTPAFHDAHREPFSWEREYNRRRDLIVPYLRTAFVAYTAAHRDRQPMARRLDIIDRWEARADKNFADRNLVPDDRAHGYNVRERALDLLHFYLCPARCRPGVAAEYLDELYQFVPSEWPVECHNFSRHFAPALSILHAGTANGQRPRRHDEPAQPRLVELSDDEDR